MKASLDDRAGWQSTPPESSNAIIWLIAVVIVVAGVSAIFISAFGFKELLAALSPTRAVPAPNPAQPVPQPFTDLYKRWGIAPLSAADLSDERVSQGLQTLSDEPCEKRAIYSVGEALYERRRARAAANVYLAFAESCLNGEGERRRTAQLLLELGDYAGSVAQASKLIEINPDSSYYHYLRAQGRAGLKEFEQALPDYAATMQLMTDSQSIGSWVFEEMATAYAAAGRSCEAIVPIQTYVALKASERDTPRARKLIETYNERGHCASFAQGADRFVRASTNVIEVRGEINGVPGRFIVDTGASFVSVSADFASKANIRGKQDRIISNTANGAIETALGTAKSVQVGHVQATDVPVVLLPKSLGKDIDGLLGQSFLSRFDVKISPREWSISAKQAGSRAN